MNQPTPLFVLRGHSCPVTAVTTFQLQDRPLLISGDESGSITIWDLKLRRQRLKFPLFKESKIIRLLEIFSSLNTSDNVSSVFVCQSRSDNVTICQVTSSQDGQDNYHLEEKLSFPTSELSFARGDALTLTGRNICFVAMPSIVCESYVAIRVFDRKLTIIASGSGARKQITNLEKQPKSINCFDIKLFSDYTGKINMLVAYEDGAICLFTVSDFDIAIETSELRPLEVTLLATLDLGIKDFISSYDFVSEANVAVVGSPHNQLIFIDDLIAKLSNSNLETDNGINRVEMATDGISCLRIRPDLSLVAAACWDCRVRIYSMKKRRLLACLVHHSKQVNDLIFFHDYCLALTKNNSLKNNPAPHENIDNKNGSYLMALASADHTISVWSIY